MLSHGDLSAKGLRQGGGLGPLTDFLSWGGLQPGWDLNSDPLP